MRNRRGESPLAILFGIVVIVGAVILLGFGLNSCTVIKPGEVGVQVTFGSVTDQPLTEGMHLLNPLSSVQRYNVMQQTWKEENVTAPSQDQLVTTLDISVQYRLIGSMAPQILRETGTAEQAIQVHLEPKLRSAIREVGKGLVRAEDFFNESTQVKLQTELMDELALYCKPKGIEVQAVLLRDIRLPPVVAASVQTKKQREQVAIQQEAELQRFTVEQQQKIATAEAEKTAAVSEAAKVKIAADAEAYKIKTINEAASSNPVYVQLQALKTLAEMAKDPAAKLYFLDGQGKTPLPLLHLGDGAAAAPVK